jgi:SOS-response transcriptional repressor LexA
MTIFDTRRDNALRLIGTERGSLSQFAQRMSMAKQQASHILGSKPIKHIGDEMARRIEQVYGLPIGSLDIRPQDIATPADSIEARLLQEIAGLPAMANHAFASSLTLSREWVRKNLAIAPEHVAIMPATGDTMAPTIFDGDLCLVDRGATRIEAPGVYVILREADTHILRVSKPLTGGYLFACDNQAYPPYPVTDIVKAGLLVLGRVLMTLRPSRI